MLIGFATIPDQPPALVFYGCCNELPQNQWFKTNPSSKSSVDQKSHWTKIKVSAGLCSFWEDSGVNLPPCLFQIVQAMPSVLGLWPFPSIFKGTKGKSVLLRLYHSDLFCLPLSLLRSLGAS